MFLWGEKQLAAVCKPEVGGVQRGREHVLKLSHLQEVLRPTRRREKGGEDTWLPVEHNESCNGNRKAKGKRGRRERDRYWFYPMSWWETSL